MTDPGANLYLFEAAVGVSCALWLAGMNRRTDEAIGLSGWMCFWSAFAMGRGLLVSPSWLMPPANGGSMLQVLTRMAAALAAVAQPSGIAAAAFQVQSGRKSHGHSFPARSGGVVAIGLLAGAEYLGMGRNGCPWASAVSAIWFGLAYLLQARSYLRRQAFFVATFCTGAAGFLAIQGFTGWNWATAAWVMALSAEWLAPSMLLGGTVALARSAFVLQDWHRHFHVAVEDSPTAGAISNDLARLWFVNPAFVRLWACESAQQACGRWVFEFLADPSRCSEILQALREKREWQGELTGRRRDSSTFPMSVAAKFTICADGRPACVQWSFVDLSGQALEARMRGGLTLGMEHASDAVLITDGADVIVYCNRAFERDSGYASSEIVGQTPAVLNSGRHDHHFYRGMGETLQGGRIWSGELVNRSKDGMSYERHATICAIPGEREQALGFVAVYHDTSRERILAARLLEAGKFQAMAVAAAGVAHDFNNLLSIIDGCCELALTQTDRGNALSSRLLEIRDAVCQASEISGQLLTLGRGERAQPEAADLNQLIGSAASILRCLAGEKVTTRISRDPQTPRVAIEPGQFLQILINLVVNARHAMPLGGTLTIETGDYDTRRDPAAECPTLNPGQYCRLAVTDTGIGMNEETKSRLFEPGFTTRASGKGMGLGLFTVSRIIQECGGRIVVCSEPQRGCSFRVYLPAQNNRQGDPEELL